MNEIKEYRPLALVFYINWKWERDVLPLDEEKREAFKKAIESSKMVELEWITINTFDIKEIRPASTFSQMENFYYSLQRAERNYIKQRTAKLSDKKLNDPMEYRTLVWEEKAIERRKSMVAYYHETLSNNQ